MMNTLRTETNWTDKFKTINDIINVDPDRFLTSVTYTIEINSPDSLDPMIVAKELPNSSPGVYYKACNNIFFTSSGSPNEIASLLFLQL